MFSLKVTSLQNTIDRDMASGTASGKLRFGSRQEQLLQPLGIIEVRQATQSELLSFR